MRVELYLNLQGPYREQQLIQHFQLKKQPRLQTVQAVQDTAKSKVKKAVAKTSKTADTNARKAKNKVKKEVAKTRVEAKRIIRKGKKQKTK